MGIYKYKDHYPVEGEGCFIAPSADLIGQIVLGDNVSIWFNTVIRGDENIVKIGDNCNIQDLSMLHVDQNFPLTIGKNVTIGHGVKCRSIFKAFNIH